MVWQISSYHGNGYDIGSYISHIPETFAAREFVTMWRGFLMQLIHICFESAFFDGVILAVVVWVLFRGLVMI